MPPTMPARRDVPMTGGRVIQGASGDLLRALGLRRSSHRVLATGRRRGRPRPRAPGASRPSRARRPCISATRGAIAAPRSGSSCARRSPAREDVVERQGQLVAGRPGHLGLEERPARRPAAGGGPAPRRGPTTPGASVPCRATSRAAASGPSAATGRDRGELGGDPLECIGRRPRRRVAARPCPLGRARGRGLAPSTASMTSRAMTRYVVYLPPPIRTTPFASTDDAVLARRLDGRAADGAISGRSPAYVPTTSSRRRSTSIVALTVRSSWSTSQPSAAGSSRRSLVRRIGRADQPVVGPRHEEDDLARARGSSGRACSGSVRAARRGERRGSAGSAREPPPNGWSGSAAQTPVASTTARVRISSSVAGRARSLRPHRMEGVTRDSRSVSPIARTRVTATARRRRARSGRRRACNGRRPRRRRDRAVRRAGHRGAASARCRACRPRTVADASRRRAARRGCRTASGRRRRTPCDRNGMP